MADSESTDPRLALLLAQLDSAWNMLDARLTGRHPFQDESCDLETDMTDEEYFWEPVAGCWNLRRRDAATTGKFNGRGDWVLEYESPEPRSPGVTTIAWRLCHIGLWQLMRHDYTFGSRSLQPDDIVWPVTSTEALAFLRASFVQWRTALESITPAGLDTVGRSQMPYGLDPQVPFADLLAWTNTEFTHHAAEVGCLRDLYRAATHVGSSPRLARS